MIALLIIAILVCMLFVGRSGTQAAEQAAVEEKPVERTLLWGQASCLGVLFALIGAVGVFVLLGAMLPQ